MGNAQGAPVVCGKRHEKPSSEPPPILVDELDENHAIFDHVFAETEEARRFKREQIKRLEALIYQHQDVVRDRNRLQEANEKLQFELDDRYDEIEDLRDKIAQQDRRISQLMSQRDALQRELTRISAGTPPEEFCFTTPRDRDLDSELSTALAASQFSVEARIHESENLRDSLISAAEKIRDLEEKICDLEQNDQKSKQRTELMLAHLIKENETLRNQLSQAKKGLTAGAPPEEPLAHSPMKLVPVVKQQETAISPIEEEEPVPQNVDDALSVFFEKHPEHDWVRYSKVKDGTFRFVGWAKNVFCRVLRGSVYIRVGGGWETLSNFIEKCLVPEIKRRECEVGTAFMSLSKQQPQQRPRLPKTSSTAALEKTSIPQESPRGSASTAQLSVKASVTKK